MELRSMVFEKSSHSHAHIVNPSDGFGDSGPQATDIDANHDVSEKKGEICSVRMQEKKEERRIFCISITILAAAFSTSIHRSRKMTKGFSAIHKTWNPVLMFLDLTIFETSRVSAIMKIYIP
jgi:hypothetical protein